MGYEQEVKLKSDRERHPTDYYPTPLDLAVAALDELPINDTPNPHVLDPGAGDGVWGRALAQHTRGLLVEGIEIEQRKHPREYFTWQTGSFISIPRPKEPKADASPRTWSNYRARLWASEQPVVAPRKRQYGLVMGNPPYIDAEKFIRTSFTYLPLGGYLVLLLRLAFLAGQDRAKGLWQEYPPYKVLVCGKRPSFTGDGKTDATEYAVYYWRQGHYPGHIKLGHLDW